MPVLFGEPRALLHPTFTVMEHSRRDFLRTSALVVGAAWWPSRGLVAFGADSDRAGAPEGATIGSGVGGIAHDPWGHEELRDPDGIDALSRLLPSFRATRRREWVLLSDCAPEATRPTLDLLESTTRQVERAMRAVAAAPERTSVRHLALLFRRVGDYRDFSRTHDGFDEASGVGHYAPQARRSVLTAASASPELREAIMRLDAENSEHRARGARAVDDPRLFGDARPTRAQHRAAVDEAIDDVRQRTFRLASHETAHQILCERRVHSPDATCPAWLREGLACSFETERTIGDFGPDFDVPERRETLERAIHFGEAMPLDVLIASNARPRLGTPGTAAWYAQCWGLVVWLYRERPRVLASLLESTWESRGAVVERREEPRAGEASSRWRADRLASRRLAWFERCAGPLTDLEPAWRAAWRRRDVARPHATRATHPAARTAT